MIARQMCDTSICVSSPVFSVGSVVQLCDKITGHVFSIHNEHLAVGVHFLPFYEQAMAGTF